MIDTISRVIVFHYLIIANGPARRDELHLAHRAVQRPTLNVISYMVKLIGSSTADLRKYCQLNSSTTV